MSRFQGVLFLFLIQIKDEMLKMRDKIGAFKIHNFISVSITISYTFLKNT